MLSSPMKSRPNSKSTPSSFHVNGKSFSLGPSKVVCAMLVWCLCKVHLNGADQEKDAIILDSLSGGLAHTTPVERLPPPTLSDSLGSSDMLAHANVNLNLIRYGKEDGTIWYLTSSIYLDMKSQVKLNSMEEQTSDEQPIPTS